MDTTTLFPGMDLSEVDQAQNVCENPRAILGGSGLRPRRPFLVVPFGVRPARTLPATPSHTRAQNAVARGAQEPPRLRRPERQQALMASCWLDDLLPPDHAARAVWAMVERLDLSAFYQPLKARGSEPGRSGTDPKLLVALWLYATVEGLGSRREIVRLCDCHDAFRWLCGGVAAWRRRMGQPESKLIHSQRASTAETVNADLRTFRGLSSLVVRGLRKVRYQVLWSALAYNVMHFAAELVT